MIKMTKIFLETCWILSATLTAVLTYSTAFAQYYKNYRDPIGKFTTILYDKSVGSIFIGGLNKVYRLNEDLDLLAQGDIGPKLDHPDCKTPPPTECSYGRIFHDNYNKLLLKYGDQIVSCGTLYRGSCELLHRSNLTSTSQTISTPVVNTEGNSVGIIAGDIPKLYIGTSATIEPDLPPYTTRSLTDFEVLKVSLNKAQKKATDAAIRDGFKIDFIHAFNSNNINYFVNVYDEKYTETSSKFQTFIVHHCESDNNYISYIELPLVCTHDGQRYTLAQSAYLADMVPSESNPSEVTLLVTFGMSDSGHSQTPERKSAVCAFSITDRIEYSFLNAYRACAQGNTTFKTIKWAGTNQHTCVLNTFLTEYLTPQQIPYCHDLDSIPNLGGDAPIILDAIYQENDALFTSIVSHTGDLGQSVIMLGDDEGKLTKLRWDSITSAQRYDKQTIVSEKPVIRNGIILTKDSVYITTEQQITKLPIEECELYTTCSECISVKDPYCGWSLQLNKCFGCRNRYDCKWYPFSISNSTFERKHFIVTNDDDDTPVCEQLALYACLSQPCFNEGSCEISGKGGYTCTCSARYSGLHCEKDLDACSSQPCLNNSICNNDGIGGYICSHISDPNSNSNTMTYVIVISILAMTNVLTIGIVVKLSRDVSSMKDSNHNEMKLATLTEEITNPVISDYSTRFYESYYSEIEPKIVKISSGPNLPSDNPNRSCNEPKTTRCMPTPPTPELSDGAGLHEEIRHAYFTSSVDVQHHKFDAEVQSGNEHNVEQNRLTTTDALEHAKPTQDLDDGYLKIME